MVIVEKVNESYKDPEYYTKLKINGLHYVRVIKDGESDAKVLLLDNKNKPVELVYSYLKYLKENGNEFNSLKRIAYDLCYFFDYIMVNNFSLELLERDHMIKFANPYLLMIKPRLKIRDCIERSMLKQIPILPEYLSKNIKVLYNSKTKGLMAERISAILEHAKDFLCYLKKMNIKEVKIEKIFKRKYVRKGKDGVLGYVKKTAEAVYSIEPILKAAGIPKSNHQISPIELNVLFENKELELFFDYLKINDRKLNYRLLFNLLDITGLRVGEALGIKMFDYKEIKHKIDFKSLNGDIELVDDEKDMWRVKVVIRPDAPLDVKVKFRKPRTVTFTDSSKEFRNMLEEYLRFRKYMFKTKKKSHDYLFINRSGNRLRYGVTKNTFDTILDKIGLMERKGFLCIHSFRHGYASRWIRTAHNIRKDVDYDLLTEILGHSSSDVVKKVYYHLLMEEKEKLMNQLEESKYYSHYGEDYKNE